MSHKSQSLSFTPLKGGVTSLLEGWKVEGVQELSGSCSKSGFVIWQPFLNIEIKWSKRLRKRLVLLPDSLSENFCGVKSKLIFGNQCFSKNATTRKIYVKIKVLVAIV